MSAFAMITGRLIGEPKTRDTKNGGKVTFFRLKVANGAAREFWDVAAFADDCRAELDGLPEGFPLCATGDLSVALWERDGKCGFNLKLTAHTLTRMSAKQRPSRPAKPRQAASESWAAPLTGKEAQDDNSF